MYVNIISECKYTHIYLINNTSGKFFTPPGALARFWARPASPDKNRHGIMHRILIVSDDTFLCDLIRLSLADMRVEVHCAADAAGMRAQCRRMLFDLVIVLAAGLFLGGEEPLREVRPAGLRRPAVYVLAWQQTEQTVLSLLEAGVNQYMTFPVSLHRLRRKVADELNRTL